jgi:DNA-directed RNA polymerase subunit H
MAKKKTETKTKSSTEEIKHILIPKHEKLSSAEAKKVLEKYNVTINDLPKILITDQGIRHLDVKSGDIIKITRKSPTSGESIYYRGVVSD